MAGENCAANTPINHQYWISDYADVATDPYVKRFTVDNFGLRQETETVQDDGTGSPWDVEGSEIESRYPVRGPVSLTPRPDQMATLLPCLLGNAAISAGVFGPAGKICDFFHIGHYDPTVAKVFQYKDLVCSNWAFACSDSQTLLKLELGVEGARRDITDYSIGAFPALPLSIVKPWVFRQAVVTIGGTTYRVKDVQLSGNNNLATDDYYNSAYRTEMPSTRQTFRFRHTSPFQSASDVALLSQSANVVGQIVFTSGSNVLTIDMPSLFARPEDPAISGRNRVHNTIDWTCQYDPNTANEIPIKFTLAT